MVKEKLFRATTNRKMVSSATAVYRLTARQIEALEAGARGGAHLMRGSSMGGAKRRMIDALVTRGLLTETFPRVTTAEGNLALLDIAKRKGA